MRIVEIETFGRGGLTHYAYNLSRALAERGHDVTLVTTADYELATAHVPSDRIALLRRIGRFTAGRPPHRDGPWWRLVRRAEALLDAVAVALGVRRLRPDVVHLHCTNPIAVAYVAALRLAGCRVAYTAHVVTPHEAVPFQRVIYRALFRLSHLIVAHSAVDRARLADEFGVGDDRLVVIPHGEYGFFESHSVPADRQVMRQALGIDAEAPVALFFGYIREYKGLDVLLEAWPSVSATRPEARLVVAGDPVRLPSERRRALEQAASHVGAVCRLEYVPFLDVARYFRAADAVVMPYRRISQSGVLFLALSLGVPIVASAVGALPEVLRHDESALLVEPASPAALAAALTRVLGDPDLRARLVAGGHRVAERHGWPSIAEQTERALARLVG